MPIEIRPALGVSHIRRNIRNVSFGGLAFLSDIFLQPDTLVELRIPCVRPIFEVSARVAWCREEADCFLVGVEFQNASEAFQIRMVEQVCHIHSYKREIEERDGRQLSTEDAAREWIDRHAASFPNP